MKKRTLKLKFGYFLPYPQMNYLPRWGVLLMDMLLYRIAFWLSVWVGSGFFDYG